ncbi:uncharacterized protein DDB_G0271670-like [Malaya genurostris]|uniref:uncharacterized protein DDB_G0271670-like n=1 Tax=Malaya genurostris TaxID=325434 RepID=UPI0026F3E482|nr:uncharacterized protein DDB_G0271670-like [Malaya genurostris]XP_058453276.1 uncharacterized protein DDB_G0271670-like [Malaya genurostris]
MKRIKACNRQPDYFVGSNGIPRLVEKVVHSSEHHVGMDSTRRTSSSISPTDPVKLNKCLHNIKVRKNNIASYRQINQTNRNNKIESDIEIRKQADSKSNSSTNSCSSSSSSSRSSSSTITNLSHRPASSSSSSISVLNNWRGPVASPLMARMSDARRNGARSPTITQPIPSNSNRNYNYTCRASRQATGTTSGSNNSNIRVSGVTNWGSPVLLSNRQRSNITSAVDSNRIADSVERVMRQCRFSLAVPTPPPATDNRINYQRKYDRTIFGYNRLDQFVLPPLQI